MMVVSGCSLFYQPPVPEGFLLKDIPSVLNIPGTLNKVDRRGNDSIVKLTELCNYESEKLKEAFTTPTPLESKYMKAILDSKFDFGTNMLELFKSDIDISSVQTIEYRASNVYIDTMSIQTLNKIRDSFLSGNCSSSAEEEILILGNEVCQVEQGIRADIEYSLVFRNDVTFDANFQETVTSKFVNLLVEEGHGRYELTNETTFKGEKLYYAVILRPKPRSEIECKISLN